jgi:hypothetical protein
MSSLIPTSVNTEDLQAQIAFELAVRIIPTADVLTRFDLTAEKRKTVLKDPGFRNMVIQYRTDWEAADNVRERVRVKSGVALEDSIINLHAIANDLDTAPAARIEAVKQLASLADANPRKDGPEVGSRFSVVINLPSGDPMTIEARTPAIEGEFESDD